MQIPERFMLSATTNGRPVKITATATPGTLIHTAISGVADIDEIYLNAVNTSASDVVLTIEFGGTTSPDDLVPVNVLSGKGVFLVLNGWQLQNGLAVRAFAATTAVINISGYVNRIYA